MDRHERKHRRGRGDVPGCKGTCDSQAEHPESYVPGTIDYHTNELKQIEPGVVATAELIEAQIRITGQLETKIELQCARCLEPVVEEVQRNFDLFYSPLPKDLKPEEERLKDLDADIGFYKGDGLFLADVLSEQVLLAVPMKAICRSDCRGLCAACGANLNHEECRCERHATDPRLAPLARLKQDWLKNNICSTCDSFQWLGV
jgi:uncharacterized protein